MSINTERLAQEQALCQQCGLAIDPAFTFCGDRCAGHKFLDAQPMIENMLVEACDELRMLHDQYQRKTCMNGCPTELICTQMETMLFPHRLPGQRRQLHRP